MTVRSNEGRVTELVAAKQLAANKKTDRLFFWLLLSQWVFALGVALVYSPYAWAGKSRSINFHVEAALLGGLILNALPVFLIVRRPGATVTRHVVAVAQMLWSALFIHLTGGRIETHFHVFGSLAFLAFYRDWKLLVTATVVVAGEHLARGLVLAESVYGIVNPEWWRFLEHAFWVVFEDVVLVFGCVRGALELRAIAEREASLEALNQSIENEVQLKTLELKTAMERYKVLVESTDAVPWELDPNRMVFTYVSPQYKKTFGHEPVPLASDESPFDHIHPNDRGRVRQQLAGLAQSAACVGLDLEYRIVGAGGNVFDVRTIVNRKAQDGTVVLRGLTLDVTRQKALESELNQAQKLESVGRLAAGVAHEINTPVQFVSDSVHFVKDAMTDLSGLISKYRTMQQSIVAGLSREEMAVQISAAEEAADLEYLLGHVPSALDRSIEGLNRISTIVKSMKEFAHPDGVEKTAVDLNRAIESTLTIARNETKYVADVETDFGDLPTVCCHAGEINQAVLNIVVNAAHAIGDVVKDSGDKGHIKVRTRADGDHVVITISDTGPGIPMHVRDRIFDPFFTTKEVGKGTGQGLAIARSVIFDKHGGSLTFKTELGQGTTFFIRLPIEARRGVVSGVMMPVPEAA